MSAIESAEVEFTGATGADGFRPFVLRLVVVEGWHLAVEAGLPALAGVGAEVRGVVLPAPRPLGDLPGAPELRGWTGSLEIRGELRPDSPRPALALAFAACGRGACHPAATLGIPLS